MKNIVDGIWLKRTRIKWPASIEDRKAFDSLWEKVQINMEFCYRYISGIFALGGHGINNEIKVSSSTILREKCENSV